MDGSNENILEESTPEQEIEEGFIVEEDENDNFRHFEEQEEECTQNEDAFSGDEAVDKNANVEMDDATDDSIQGFFEHKDAVYVVRSCPHPMAPGLIISGGGDDKAIIWNAFSGYPLMIMENHFTDSVATVEFSHDGKYAAIGSLSGQLLIVSLHMDESLSFQSIAIESGLNEIAWCSWHTRGHALLVGGNKEENSFCLFSLPSGDLLSYFQGRSNCGMTCAKFTPDGKRVVSANENGEILLWNPKTASILCKYTNLNGISIVSFDVTNTVALFGDIEGNVRLVHLLQDQKLLESFDNLHNGESVEDISIHPGNGQLALSGGMDAAVNIIENTSSGWKVRGVAKHPDGVVKVKWIPTEKNQFEFVTGSLDGVIRRWDSRASSLVQEWRGKQQSPLLDLDFIFFPNENNNNNNNKNVISGIVASYEDGTCLVFAFEE